MLILIAMLEKLIKPGKNSDACIYFDRCRKLRSVAASVYAATGQSLYLRYFLKNPKGIYHHHKGNTKTMFLEMMVKGMHYQMPVATSRNVIMASIMVSYIIKALDI